VLRTPATRLGRGPRPTHHPAADRLRHLGEALDRAAEGFRRVHARAANAVGVFSCSKATNEMNFVAQKFARAAMGSNNID
jgi:predicted molibdopterin-dependent oxidoreductase YjgC